MRLPRQQAFVLLLVGAIGCSDSVGPKLSATFNLVDINGRAIPTFLAPTPGLTPTILFASVTLDKEGKALWLEERREFDGTQTSIRNTFDYRITLNRIEIGSNMPCPSNANCVGTYTGEISNETLSLNVQSTDAGPIVYNFRTNFGLTPF